MKKKKGDTLLACPRDYHRDDTACKPSRTFQTFVGAGCVKPPYKQKFPEPPGESKDGVITSDEGFAADAEDNKPEDPDAPADQSKCSDKDVVLDSNHFKQHVSSFEDDGKPVTCARLKEMGGCNDDQRPTLAPKVRKECPCTCGTPPAMPDKEPPPPPHDAVYTAQLKREHKCSKDNWDFANTLQLYKYKGHIKVKKMERGRMGGCGVNRSPLRFFWPCMESFPFFGFQPLAKGAFGWGSGNRSQCSGNPAYDDGVRIGSELIEIDGSQDWHKWGVNALKHLDKNQCHEIIFQGPDPPWFQFNYNRGWMPDPILFWQCLFMSPGQRARGGWAPEGCKGMGGCKKDEGEICCVRHKNLQHEEDAYQSWCPNGKLCKDDAVCDKVEWPVAFKDEDALCKTSKKKMPKLCKHQVYDQTCSVM